MEKISVIVPIFRVEKYLDECIRSIQNQTYSNLEIILVDDGSDDRCGEICEAYKKKDQRIIVVHQNNKGQDQARKAGMKVATGKYIGYVDGDDWIDSTMYEKMYNYMKQYQVKVVESGVYDSWENTEICRYSHFEEGAYIGKVFDEELAPHLIYSGHFFRMGLQPYLVNKLFERTVIEKYQMIDEPTNNLVDDVMCVYPCLYEARSIYITHESFYHYRVRTDSSKRIVREDTPEIVFSHYKRWMNKFEGAVLSDQIEKQMDYLVLFLLLSKSPEIFDQNKNEFLIPYGGVEKNSTIVLYGAGVVGIHLYNYIESVKSSTVIAWVDKNYKTLKNNLPVSSPRTILDEKFDYIIVAILSETAANSAKHDLACLGIPENKIKWILGEYIENPHELLAQIDYKGKKLFTSGE